MKILKEVLFYLSQKNNYTKEERGIIRADFNKKLARKVVEPVTPVLLELVD